MSWHIEATLLERYAEGELDQARSASLEAHLFACEQCRALTATAVAPARLETTWTGLRASIERPSRRPIERALTAIGMRDHIARLVAATPTLQASWFAAITIAITFAVLAARNGPRGVLLFLVLAPLIPLAGVAFAFGPGVDPTYEVGAAAPMRGFSLLLVRAGTVLATTILVLVAASAAIPGVGWMSVAWLLPALGVTLSALALSTWLEPLWAAGWVGFAWIAGTTVSAAANRGAPLLDRVSAFSAQGQATFALVVVVAAVVMAVRAPRFDLRRN